MSDTPPRAPGEQAAAKKMAKQTIRKFCDWYGASLGLKEIIHGDGADKVFTQMITDALSLAHTHGQQVGAEQMREEAAKVAEAETQNSSGESRQGRSYENVYERACRTIAEAIRALPVARWEGQT